MATLQKIRSKGPLLIIVVGVALFSFIAGDAWKMFQPHQSQDVGEVNGTTLSVREFQRLMEELTDVVKFTRGTRSLTDTESDQIRDEVWNTYVQNQLIANEAEKIGLVVTNAEIQDIIEKGTSPMLANTPFINQSTGRFDKDILQNFLAQYVQYQANAQRNKQQTVPEEMLILKRYWDFIEKSMRNDRLAQKYYALVSKAVASNPVDAQAAFDNRTQRADLLLAAIPYSTVADSTVKVKESEVKAIYDKRKEMYRQMNETRNVKYIDVHVTASDADKAALSQDMATYTNQLEKTTEEYAEVIREATSLVPYSELFWKRTSLPADISARLDSVHTGGVFGPYFNAADNTMNSFKKIAVAQRPDSVEYRLIQVMGADMLKTTATADSIVKALKGGADFEAVAELYGQFGQTTWVTSAMYQGGQLSADQVKLIQTLVTSPVNKPVDLTVGVNHVIVEVTKRRAMTEMYQVAAVKRTVDFSAATYNKAYNDFSQFVSANSTLSDFAKNAEEAGYKLLESKDIATAARGIGGIKGTREALRWVFQAKPGEVSALYECGDGAHMLVVALEQINKKGYRAWDDPEVLPSLRAEVVKDKKAAIIQQEIKAANPTSLDAYLAMKGAVKDSVKYVSFSAPAYVAPLFSSEPLVSAYASLGKADQLSAPVKGNGGVLVMQIYAKENAPETFDAKKEEQTQVSLYQRQMGNFVQDLYMKAKVVDNRYLFF